MAVHRTSSRLPAALLAGLLLAGCGDDLPGLGTDDSDPEGDIVIDGLAGPVQVHFDEHGILHARCEDERDCFLVEGYYHAAHRFVQMDIRRRLGRGRLSRLAGAVTLPTDMRWRHMMNTRDGTPLVEQLWAHADARTRAALEAYSAGVNAWLTDLAEGDNGAVLADEYGFDLIDASAVRPDWEPLDSIACVLPLLDGLTNHAGPEMRAGEAHAVLGPDVFADLFAPRPASPSVIMPDSGVRSARPGDATGASGVQARLAAARPLFTRALEREPDAHLDPNGRGSNNWVVAPERAGGVALLANDPHLGLSNPAIWYLVHLDARDAGGDGLHVAGASFAGLPGIILGQNEDIAWGATTTMFDATDVYVETLNEDGTAVILDGQEVPIIAVEEEFEVALQDATVETFHYVPHHGPVVAIDEEAGTALTVRWTGHDADTDINFFLALAAATSVEEARAALENVTTVGQNFVVIDRGGHIGWFPYNRLPTRPWASAELPPYLPLPGDGSAEWGEPIPYDQLPQAYDPAQGYIATANNDMTGALLDGDPTDDGYPFMQTWVDIGYRHQRIAELLEAEEEHTLAGMQAIQADVYSLAGELIAPVVVEEAELALLLSEDGQAVVDALAAWDHECPTGLAGLEPDAAPADEEAVRASARGCAAFHVLWPHLRDLTFEDELDAAGIEEPPLPSALVFALLEPGRLSQTYWDDVSTTVPVETRLGVVTAALDQAGAELRRKLGDPEDWLWGRLHTVTLRADLFDAAGVTAYNSDTFAVDGGLFTVDVAHPSDDRRGRYDTRHGASMRLACQAGGAGVACEIDLPGGQRHHRDSPFYNSLLDEWLTNRAVPLTFSVDAVAETAVESVLITPPR